MTIHKGLDPDSRGMLWTAVGLLGIMAIVAFMMSATSLAAIGEWAMLPWTMLWTVPVVMDTSITAFTIAILIFRARGKSTFTAWVLLLVCTSLSAGGNASHVLGERDPSDWRTWVGAGVAAFAPIAQFVTTHVVARLIVAEPGQPVEAAEPAPLKVKTLDDAAVAVEQIRGLETQVNTVIVGANDDGMPGRQIAAQIGWDRNKVQRHLAKAKKEREDQTDQEVLEEVAA